MSDADDQVDQDERLTELQDDIDDARRQAEEHGTLASEGDDDEPQLIDPDDDGDVDPYRAQPPG